MSAGGFEVRYETELANDYGNLASRTLAMIDRYRDGVIPEAGPDPELVGGSDGLDGLPARVRELLDRAELTEALEEIWRRVRRLNRYVEETRPWELAKDDADADRLDEVLYNLAEGLRVVTLLLYAYVPASSRLCSPRSARRGSSSPSSDRAAGGSERRSSPRCSLRSRHEPPAAGPFPADAPLRDLHGRRPGCVRRVDGGRAARLSRRCAHPETRSATRPGC